MRLRLGVGDCGLALEGEDGASRRRAPPRRRDRASGASRPRRRGGRPTAAARVTMPCAHGARSRRRRSGTTTASKRRFAGSGTIWSVARVITPSVPSEPTKSCVSSGPTAWRGTGTVSIVSPVGSTTRSASRRSSILPYRVESTPGAAGGDVAAHRREVDGGRVVRQHQPALVQLLLEAQAVHARLGGDGQRGLVDFDDAVEPRQVEHDPAPRRHCAALAARAAAPRDDGDAQAVRDVERGRDVLLGRRPHDDVRRPSGVPAARAATAFQYVSAA